MAMSAARGRHVSPVIWLGFLYFALQWPSIVDHPETVLWIAINLPVALLALLASVALHELGHAVIGRLVGMDVLEICLGTGERWARFHFGECRIELRTRWLGGLTRLAPATVRWLRLRRAASAIGGPAASLLVVLWALGPLKLRWFEGVPASAICSRFWDDLVFHLRHGVAFTPFLALWSGLGVLNLVPFATTTREGQTVESDGLRLLKLPFLSEADRARLGVFGLELRAMRALEDGDARRCLALLEPALMNFPGDRSLSFGGAAALVLLDRLDEARALLDPLLLRQEIPSRVRGQMANLLAWGTLSADPPDVDAADALSAQANETLAREADVRNGRGCVLVLRGGRDAEAIELLNPTATSSSQRRAMVSAALAVACGREGLPEAAARHWAEVERSGSDSPFVRHLRLLASDGLVQSSQKSGEARVSEPVQVR